MAGYERVYFCLLGAFKLVVLFLTFFLTPIIEAVINTAGERARIKNTPGSRVFFFLFSKDEQDEGVFLTLVWCVFVLHVDSKEHVGARRVWDASGNPSCSVSYNFSLSINYFKHSQYLVGLSSLQICSSQRANVQRSPQ